MTYWCQHCRQPVFTSDELEDDEGPDLCPQCGCGLLVEAHELTTEEEAAAAGVTLGDLGLKRKQKGGS